MKVAVIGAGRIGQIHAKNVAEMAGLQLVAVHDAIDTSANALAEKLNAKAVSLEAILSDKAIEVVMICSPTDSHADIIELAAKASKKIFCEKPIDLSSNRVKACLKTVEKHNTPLMIGFNRRFDPNFAEVKRRLQAGFIGKTELVTILSRDPSPPPVDYVKRSGGLFRDMMIHDLDMARFMVGEEFVELFATGSSLVDPKIGEAGDVDTAAVTLKTKSGIIVQISNSRRASYGYDQRIEIHGSKGLLKAENILKSSVIEANSNGILQEPVQDFFLERYEVAYKNELKAFFHAIKTNAAITPSGFDGLKAQELADAATESANTGKVIKLSH
jgi:myo-inositol 2-dehydrogenase / D-chiro-inositol 1-dehydrogenase